ncbi:unnamed protein product [Cyprideis torosa]|uniref:Uncharacterized protein n=1 Tax=Cyprideis torosa TaxID=163714 RepID=A0A7R8ZRS7_9CRUS|nr:unnamed protein product [Cyprideis torosa]CAG0899770.1 unnamed protein product [Cyprideis torosa]
MTTVAESEEEKYEVGDSEDVIEELDFDKHDEVVQGCTVLEDNINVRREITQSDTMVDRFGTLIEKDFIDDRFDIAQMILKPEVVAGNGCQSDTMDNDIGDENLVEKEPVEDTGIENDIIEEEIDPATGYETYAKCRHFLTKEEDIEAAMKIINESTFLTLPEELSTRPTKECTAWEYDTTYYVSTASSYYDWVCEKSSYPTDILTIASFGSVFSSLFFGPLADTYGRRAIFYFTLTIQVVFGMSNIFAPNFMWFAIIVFCSRTAFPTSFQSLYLNILEQVSPEKRARIGALINIWWVFGVLSLTFCAWLVRGNWVYLALIGSLPLTLCYLLWKYSRNSPRWLLSRYRIKECAEMMEDIAKMNGRLVPQDLEPRLRKIRESEQDTPKFQFAPLFTRFRLARTTAITTVCITSVQIMYYALYLNIGGLAGNPYLNSAILGAIELPAYLLSWWMMDNLGRRWSQSMLQLSCGILAMIMAFCPAESEDDGVKFGLDQKFWSWNRVSPPSVKRAENEKNPDQIPTSVESQAELIP